MTPESLSSRPLTNPTLLALETSTDVLSVALLHDDQVSIQEISLQGANQAHSGEILPAVTALLESCGISLVACDAIAFDCGPGAFTGLRIAAGVAQGLAFALDKPVIPIVSLCALATPLAEATVAETADMQIETVISLLDARMGEVYAAVYARDPQLAWRPVLGPSLLAPAEVAAFVSTHTLDPTRTCVGGNGLAAYPMLLESLREYGVPVLPQAVPHARDLVQLAAYQWHAGGAVSAVAAQPLYVRNKVAQTTAERLQHARAQQVG